MKEEWTQKEEKRREERRRIMIERIEERGEKDMKLRYMKETYSKYALLE